MQLAVEITRMTPSKDLEWFVFGCQKCSMHSMLCSALKICIHIRTVVEGLHVSCMHSCVIVVMHFRDHAHEATYIVGKQPESYQARLAELVFFPGRTPTQEVAVMIPSRVNG